MDPVVLLGQEALAQAIGLAAAVQVVQLAAEQVQQKGVSGRRTQPDSTEAGSLEATQLAFPEEALVARDSWPRVRPNHLWQLEGSDPS